MELTLDQALQKGIEAHKAGNVQEADRYYTAILNANPKHPDANHNMGVLAASVGKVKDALPFLEAALDAKPDKDQFWLSYIDVLIKLYRIADAKAVFDQAKSNGAKGDEFDQIEKRIGLSSSREINIQDPPKEELNSLIKLYNQNRLQQVFNNAQILTKRYTSSPSLWNLIGASAAQLGQLDGAVTSFQKAVSLKPDFAEAHNNMGIALKDLGKLKEAIEAFNRAFIIKPDFAEAHKNAGNALKDQGKLEEAVEAYNTALSIKPDTADVHNNMGNALQNQDKLEEAVEAYKKALSIKPDFAEAYYNMGNALQDQDKLDEAVEAYNKALFINPDNADAYNNIGIARQEQGDLKAAGQAYEKVLSLKPNYAEAHRHLAAIKKYTLEDEQFRQVQELYKSEVLSDDAKCSLSFALAKMYEDINKLDQAFKYLSEGNTLRKKLINYSIDQDKNLFKNLKIAQPILSKNKLAVKYNSTRLSPIYIVGMPRSGTSLVEQIIASHSEVTGAGELRCVQKFGIKLAIDPMSINTQAVSEFRQTYLSRISQISGGKQFVTDKMPQNFRFIPLIYAAFPQAKIVHVQRNATATCWSNYKHYFVSDGLGYCYDLKDVVTYFDLYNDLMNFWQSEYSGRIYNLNYEKLTTNQEHETRKLIEHLDLPWENNCLSPEKNKRNVRTASQQQVRRKVYQGSSEAWRKYEPFLNDAFNSLTS